jgi:hypothetical protein
MNQPAADSSIDWKKVFLALLIIAILGYQWYQNQANPVAIADRDPQLSEASDQTTPQTLPQTRSPALPPTLPQKSGGDLSPTGTRGRDVFLTSSGGRNLISPAGLIYTMGAGGEHRVDHVMRHSRDDKDRDVHGVFDGDEEDILRLIDEAYQLVKSGSRRVTTDDSDDNVVHTVAMERRIGYEGGQRGNRSRNRPLTRLRLVLRENRIITAYPYR